MYIRRIITFILLSTLVGCSTPKIYLVTQGYQVEQVNQFKKSLQPLDYELVISDVAIPESFAATSVAINPKFNDPELLQAIDNVLVSHGLAVSVEYRFSNGNHFYTEDNIGLYIRNPTVSQQYKLPPYIRTQYCTIADGTLALNTNGTAVLEYEFNNDGSDEMIAESGFWHFSNNKLTINIKNEIQEFRLYDEEKETPYGSRPADVFKPKNQLNILEILNCEFMIIYI